MQKTSEMDMTSGGLARKIILFTIPLMLSGVLQSLYNVADMVVIGRFVGDDALSSVGAAGVIYNIIVNLFMGLSVGIDVTCSFAHGRGDGDGVKKVIDTAVMSALCVGAAVTVIGLLFTAPVLRLMKTPEENGVFSGAVLYLQIIFVGVPFTMMYNFCAAILRTKGETRVPFFILALSGLANVVFNVLLVTVFRLGVAGVAISTVFSQFLSALLILLRLMSGQGLFRFSLRSARFDVRTFGRIFSIGILAGIQSAMFSIANAFLQAGVNSFGKAAIAGNTSAETVENLVWIASASFHYATVTFISQNLGAGKFDRIRRTLWITTAFAASAALVLGMGVFLLRRQLMVIFLDPGTEAFSYACRRIAATFPYYFLAGIMATVPEAIRGLGYGTSPTIVSLVGVIGLRITWFYTVFRSVHTFEVLYLAHPVSWIVTDAASIVLFIVLFRRKKRAFEKAVDNSAGVCYTDTGMTPKEAAK